MTQKEYVEQLKQAFKDAGIRLVMEQLALQYAFFGTSIGSILLGLVVRPIINILVNETAISIYFFYIDMRTVGEANAFNKAVTENAEAQKNGTPEQKQIAETNLVNALRELVRFHGMQQPPGS